MAVIELLHLEYDEMLIHIDYSEDYQCQQQIKIQNAYFRHKSFSLFTACGYFRSTTDDNEVRFLPITIVTEASEKSRVALLSCISKIISHAESLIGNVVENAYIFSNGMSSQFHSRFVFHFLTKIQL